MGLRFSASDKDFGLDFSEKGSLPTYTIESEETGNGESEPVYTQDGEWDFEIAFQYPRGNQVFVDTFLTVAQDLCPVDTGYLLSTIDASWDDTSVSCWTDCSYAQYVEYGTSKMSAQPFFAPAIEAAYGAALPVWKAEQRAQRQAQYQQELIENQDFIIGDLVGSIVSMLLFILLMAIIMAFIEMLIQALDESFSLSGNTLANLDSLIEITD